MTTDVEKLLMIIRLGIQMRAAQNKYFKTRDRGDLVTSKQFEKNFDIAAAEAFK